MLTLLRYETQTKNKEPIILQIQNMNEGIENYEKQIEIKINHQRGEV